MYPLPDGLMEMLSPLLFQVPSGQADGETVRRASVSNLNLETIAGTRDHWLTHPGWDAWVMGSECGIDEVSMSDNSPIPPPYRSPAKNPLLSSK